jgi:hypothetical protein
MLRSTHESQRIPTGSASRTAMRDRPTASRASALLITDDPGRARFAGAGDHDGALSFYPGRPMPVRRARMMVVASTATHAM